MSKTKIIATAVAIVAIVVLAAFGAGRVELARLVDIGVGVGGVIAAIVAVFKKE